MRGWRSWLENAKGLWALLRLLSMLVGFVVPPAVASNKVGFTLGMLGTMGGVVGWKWGAAETLPRDVGRSARRLIYFGLGFLATYLVLEVALPQVGRLVPIIYGNDQWFWALIVVRGLIWGGAAGAFARLLTLLHRKAALAESGRC